MGGLVNTLFRTLLLDDEAYQEWRERPNLFLRGIVLIIVISLVAGLVSFAVTLVQNVNPVNMAQIEDEIQQSFDLQYQYNPGWQDPEMREMMEEMIDVIIPMITDITEIEAPLPHSITGFFQAIGGWLSRAFSAIGGWLLYGALVLIAVNLLGGSAKLPHFLGMVALYIVPGLLAILNPVPCVGGLLAFIGTIWSVVVYIKAVSVASDLDVGQSVLAVFAPFLVLMLLGVLLAILGFLWILLLAAF